MFFYTRSEIDYLMAKMLVKMGQRDSARVYLDRLRSAWNNADPEPRRRLAALSLP